MCIILSPDASQCSQIRVNVHIVFNIDLPIFCICMGARCSGILQQFGSHFGPGSQKSAP